MSQPSRSAATGSSLSRSPRADLDRRVAGHVQLARGERAAGERGQRAVADVDAGAIDGDAQDLAGDVGQRRGLPGAEVGDPGAHHHRPILLEADPARRPVGEEHRPAVGLHAAGKAAADPSAPERRRRLAQLRERPVQALAGPGSVSISSPVTRMSPCATKLRSRTAAGSRPRRSSDPVELGLIAEHHLHRAEAAHRAGRDGVGEHRVLSTRASHASVGPGRVDHRRRTAPGS